MLLSKYQEILKHNQVNSTGVSEQLHHFPLSLPLTIEKIKKLFKRKQRKRYLHLVAYK